MFNDSNYFYSSNVYRHADAEYQNYYGSKQDHMIDFIAINNPYDTKLNTSIQYSSDVRAADRVTPLAITFDRLIAYNSKQSTGLQNLTLHTNGFEPEYGDSIIVRKTDNKWKLHDLRNYAAPNEAIWSSN